MRYILILMVACSLTVFLFHASIIPQTVASFSTPTAEFQSTTDDCYAVTSEIEIEAVEDVTWSHGGGLLAVTSQNDILIFS